MTQHIKHGYLYAINNGGHPDIDPPEPYLCINIDGQPLFVRTPFLAESGNGPHNTTPHEQHARQYGWQLNPDTILGDWETHKPKPTPPADRIETLHTPHHTSTTVITTDQDGWTADITIRTSNPYTAYTLMRYLGHDQATATRTTGVAIPTINTPELGEGA